VGRRQQCCYSYDSKDWNNEHHSNRYDAYYFYDDDDDDDDDDDESLYDPCHISIVMTTNVPNRSSHR
jgi:hypothetical protein